MTFHQRGIESTPLRDACFLLSPEVTASTATTRTTPWKKSPVIFPPITATLCTRSLLPTNDGLGSTKLREDREQRSRSVPHRIPYRVRPLAPLPRLSLTAQWSVTLPYLLQIPRPCLPPRDAPNVPKAASARETTSTSGLPTSLPVISRGLSRLGIRYTRLLPAGSSNLTVRLLTARSHPHGIHVNRRRLSNHSSLA